MKLTPEQKIKLFRAGLHSHCMISQSDQMRIAEQDRKCWHAGQQLGINSQLAEHNAMGIIHQDIAENLLQHDIDNFAAMIINIINDNA